MEYYDFRGIKKKKNGYYSCSGWHEGFDFFFIRDAYGDLVLKNKFGRQVVRNFSAERQDALNNIYMKLSKQRNKLGYILYIRNSKGNPYRQIEFKTGRQYELSWDPLFESKPGITYLDNNEFVPMDMETREKYNLYGIPKEGCDIYDETYKPFSNYL